MKSAFFGRSATLLLAAFFLFLPLRAMAGLTRFEISKREPWAGGREFAGRGAYERLRGKAWFEVDPGAKANSLVVDLTLAPRNKAGRVEFSADVEILAPADLSKAGGAIFYDVNNRGGPTCLGTISSGGEHFLMREGYILVFSGWIAELLPNGRNLVLDAPVATRAGEPIKGLVRSEIVVNQKTERKALSGNSGHGSYEPTERGEGEGVLTRRLREKDRRTVVERSKWKLEKSWPVFRGEKSALPKVELVLEGGLEPGFIYELVYEARNPVVQGLGMAGIRDLLSFLKHSRLRSNPLLLASGSPAARYAYGFGTSQSGRLLRMFLYDGFNADEQGRKVFDAVMPHVAGGGLGFFNHRFASPTRYSTQHESHLYPTDYFPFSYGEQKDHLSGRTDGILRRARAAGVVPKVLHTQSSSEYWHRSASLVHTDTAGRMD
ncbi:MAG: alpha/beta hydrolase domain-containing protein, partial [Planctomycetota bacterium]|nr:alpha/beta hydrolase domain-containing protein [Planctomycetota bacterium]